MTVLRELVARLGFQVDGNGFRQAESAVSRVRTGLRELASVAATIGIGAAAKQVIELASDAQETRNVLQQAFGAEGATVVQQWADRIGQEIGRSRYEIEQFTATMGAMLGPMVGSQEAAQEMSTTIAQLAVDLGSFFNTTDNEALTALRAGLAGESEPLRRYGVVLLDATLQEFAHAQGITKRVQAMNVAEKTQLRYQFILANTATAQGDAARTSEGYANSIKALRGALKDMGTEIGASILPKVEKVIRGARDGLAWFRDWARTTTLLETAMASVAAVALIAGGAALAPWIPLLATFAAIVLVLDDINALFQGGTSLIGNWLDTAFGIGTANELVEDHRSGVEMIVGWWNSATAAIGEFCAVMPGLSGMWEILKGHVMDFGDLAAIAVHDVADSIASMLNELGRASVKAVDELRGVFGLAPTGWTLPQIDTGGGARARSALANKRLERDARIRAADGPLPGQQGATGNTIRAAGRGIDAPAETVAFGVARTVSARGPGKTAAAAPANVAVGGSTVNVYGGDVNKIKQVVREVMDAERRKTAAALAGAGG